MSDVLIAPVVNFEVRQRERITLQRANRSLSAGLIALAIAISNIAAVQCSSAAEAPRLTTELGTLEGANMHEDAAPERSSNEPATPKSSIATEPTESHSSSPHNIEPTKMSDWLLVAFTAILALFTGLLWDSTNKLWKAGERQIDVARDASVAAKDAADAAKNALVLSRKTAERQLRAYVTSTTIYMDLNADEKYQPIGWLFSPEWKNSGSTPTKNLRVWTVIKLFRPDVPPDFDFPEPDIEGNFTGVIGPNLSVRTGGTFISFADIEAARRGEGKIYLWSRIDYDDVFEETPHHHTAIAVEVMLTQPQLLRNAGAAPFSFRPHEKGNTND